MRETGYIQTISEGWCTVAVNRSTACGENCASCGAGCGGKRQLCRAKNDLGAKVGDKVVIEMDSARVLKSAFLVYILPLLVFFGVFAAVNERASEGMSIAAAAASGALIFAALHLWDKRRGAEYSSQVVEIIEKDL